MLRLGSCSLILHCNGFSQEDEDSYNYNQDSPLGIEQCSLSLSVIVLHCLWGESGYTHALMPAIYSLQLLVTNKYQHHNLKAHWDAEQVVET